MLPDLKPHIIRRMLGKDDARILEIGASDGTDTVEFLEAFPKGRIDCFECDPLAIRLWKQKIPGDHPRAKLWEFALGEKTGRATFHQSGGRPPAAQWEGLERWHYSGSLLAPDKHSEYEPWLTFPTKIDVEVRTLDEMYGDIFGCVPWCTDPGCVDGNIIDFAWVDVQGAEAGILRAAKDMIRRIRYWYCEAHCKPYYHGQATLQEIRSLLPGFVFQSEHSGENYLFRSTELT